MVRVKVCCISSEEELARAVAAGASAVGLVHGMTSAGRVITDELIQRLAHQTPPGVSRFLLTPALDADGIVAHVRRTGVDVVQVCDHVAPSVLREVRASCPARVVAVVHAGAERAGDYARQAAEYAHALLLDSGRPGADFLELGGTGRTHDWGVARRLVDASPVPVWLAGGLNASNVQDALKTVRPWGVDLCTGVRTDGHLDPAKIHGFMEAVRAGS